MRGYARDLETVELGGSLGDPKLYLLVPHEDGSPGYHSFHVPDTQFGMDALQARVDLIDAARAARP